MQRSLTATVLTLALSGLAPLVAQEESQPPSEPPVEETQEPQPPPPDEEPSAEETPEDSEVPPEEEVESAEDETAPRQLSPEEEAKREEARRKREERQAKRQAKKDTELQKAEDKVAKGEANRDDQLAKLLAKGYAALDAERYKNALEAFNNRLEQESDIDFDARMGLARTLFAMDRSVEAIEQALKASRDAESLTDRSDALVFAGDLALRAVPRDEATDIPLPGSDLYVATAWRYYIQAIMADPKGAVEARQRMDEIFPTPPDPRSERLYGRFLELAPDAHIEHVNYVAAAYEALISGPSSAPVAVVGGISAPVKTYGKRPPYPRPPNEDPPRRLLASLIIETDGTVSIVRILNGISRRLNKDARETFEAWTFEPARLPDGTPVRAHYLVGASPLVIEPEATAVPTAESESPPDEGDPEADQ